MAKTEEIYLSFRNALLKEHGLTYKTFSNYVASGEFEKALGQSIRENDYTAKGFISLFMPLLSTYKEDYTERDWLKYLFEFALNKNFEEVSDYQLIYGLQEIADILLKLFSIFNEWQKTSKDHTFLSTYPFHFLGEEEKAALEDRREYDRFVTCFQEGYVYELMKIDYELTHHSTIEHISGVHYLSMYVARQLKHKGIKVNLGWVSGAAAGHDIGKYGVKKDEIKRIAYYHYYYSDQWFEARNMESIRNIAVNHSTWDLELENMSLESLLLIYADFRVKATNEPEDPFRMKFYDLDESFDVILQKLDNLDEAKEKRYRKVYSKLKDFETYLINQGINVSLTHNLGHQARHYEYALLQGKEILDAYKDLAVESNLHIMHLFRSVASLQDIFKEAKSNRDLNYYRRHLDALDTYYLYLSPGQKKVAIDFLYDSMWHNEEDIRAKAARTIGKFIGSYDVVYKKELPPSAKANPLYEEKINLIDKYIGSFFTGRAYLTKRKRNWIIDNAARMVRHLLYSLGADKRIVFTTLKDYYQKDFEDFQQRVLLGVGKELTSYDLPKDLIGAMKDFILAALQADKIDLRLMAVDNLDRLLEVELFTMDPAIEQVIKIAYQRATEAAEAYALGGLLSKYCHEEVSTKLDFTPSSLYLSNLKSATPEIVKAYQIKMLAEQATFGEESNKFYLGIHLCNLLKVSGYDAIRNFAGKTLLSILPLYSKEHINDLAIELLRSLEMEDYQFTKYIPKYLGRMLISLNIDELLEIVEDLKYKVRKASPGTRIQIIRTVGYALEKLLSLGELEGKVAKELMSVLFSGLVNRKDMTNHFALTILGANVMKSMKIGVEAKGTFFKPIAKKLLTIVTEQAPVNDVETLTRAYFVNCVYGMLSSYENEVGPFDLPVAQKIAFYPGTFDPCSLGQREVAEKVSSLGYEVYLYIDEFNWSRRAQPNLLRRTIAEMTLADEANVFLFPRNIPINMNRQEDLNHLDEIFPKGEACLVVGEDVLSAMEEEKRREFSKRKLLIIHREDKVDPQELYRSFEVKPTIITTSSENERIGPEMIRNAIASNWSLSDILDPLAEDFIYQRNMYSNEPYFKHHVREKDYNIAVLKEVKPEWQLKIEHELRLEANLFTDSPIMLLTRPSKLSKIDAVLVYGSKHEAYENQLAMEGISLEQVLTIDSIYAQRTEALHHVAQVVFNEALLKGIADGKKYVVVKKQPQGDQDLYLSQGLEDRGDYYFGALEKPIILLLDLQSVMKNNYRKNTSIRDMIGHRRDNLLEAIHRMHPDRLVLVFDRSVMYERLVDLITETNQVDRFATDGQIGPYMCVPYSDIFKRWMLPGTVTKAYHTDRVYSDASKRFDVKAFPNYLTLKEQTRVIKAFRRPTILVDDLLNSGYRLVEILKQFSEEEVPIKKVVVGISTDNGLQYARENHVPIESAYHIDEISGWYLESELYPFLGGESTDESEAYTTIGLPSINKIIPYNAPDYAAKEDLLRYYDFTLACIENSKLIMEEIENEFTKEHGRDFTLHDLSDVFITPRFPTIGVHRKYDLHVKPSIYIGDICKDIKRFYQVSSDQEKSNSEC